MKISKVDHVRSAVAKQQKKAISGILYSSPSKSSNSSINIEQRLTKLLGNAKRLYNPFISNSLTKTILNYLIVKTTSNEEKRTSSLI